MAKIYELKIQSKIRLSLIIMSIILNFSNCKDYSEHSSNKNKYSIYNLLKNKNIDEILELNMFSNRTFLLKGVKDTFSIDSKIILPEYIDISSSNAKLKTEKNYYVIKPIKANHECIIMIYYTKDSSYFLGKKVYNVRDSK
jgi:hypothetical protein